MSTRHPKPILANNEESNSRPANVHDRLQQEIANMAIGLTTNAVSGANPASFLRYHCGTWWRSMWRKRRRSVRVIGDPDWVIKSLTRCGHSCKQNIEGLEKYDVTISIEVREFETAEYGRDLLASGGKGAMIIGSHESGEENGMEYFTSWFEEHLPGIRIEFIPTSDRLWTL
jgi:hypothetical protein